MKTRYEHKIGCKCIWCGMIDKPGWYSELSPYMKEINARLAEKPSGVIEVDFGVNYWDEGYFDS